MSLEVQIKSNVSFLNTLLSFYILSVRKSKGEEKAQNDIKIHHWNIFHYGLTAFARNKIFNYIINLKISALTSLMHNSSPQTYNVTNIRY